MALIKSIAGYIKDDGSWEPQKNVEIGSMEEAAFLADSNLGEHVSSKPQPISLEDRMNLLVNDSLNGPKTILANQAKHTSDMKAWQEKYDSLLKDFLMKHKEFNDTLLTLPPGTLTC